MLNDVELAKRALEKCGWDHDIWKLNEKAEFPSQGLAQQVHAMLGWAHFEYNTFKLTHSLTAALLLTDTNKDELPDLPYDSFLVELPDGLVKSRDQDGFITHILVDRFALGTVEGLTLEWAGRSLTESHRASKWRVEELNSFEDSPDFGLCLHIVRNFCSWLNTKIEVPKLENERAVVRKTNKGEPVQKMWRVGHTVKISRELMEVARKQPVGLWKLKHRFIVRGHWRNQAKGKGRLERERIWIEPHYRGPKDGEVWRHIYEAE